MDTEIYNALKPIHRTKAEAIKNNRAIYDAIDSLPLKKPTKEYIFHIIDSRLGAVGKEETIFGDNQFIKHQDALSKVIQELISIGYPTGSIHQLFWESLFEEEYWGNLGNRRGMQDAIISQAIKINRLSNRLKSLEAEDQ